jgi:hypothetical protein
MYTVELQTVEKDEDLKNVRSKHTMNEYDTRHPIAFYYLLTQCIKKALFVGIALYYNNYLKYQLLISATVAFFSCMFTCYMRPFKSPFFNLIIIYEDVMLFILYLILFRYISADSVKNINLSESWARLFAIALFLMCVVPIALHILDMIRIMKFVNTICDWKPRFRDDDETDSEENNISDTLSEDIRPEDDSTSVVEKTITLTDNSLDDVDEGKGAQKTPPMSFIEAPKKEEPPEAPKPTAAPVTNSGP